MLASLTSPTSPPRRTSGMRYQHRHRPRGNWAITDRPVSPRRGVYTIDDPDDPGVRDDRSLAGSRCWRTVRIYEEVVMTIENKAVLVTGANRGIGRALVEEALRRGARRVYAGTRRPLAHPDARVTPLALDVTDAAQIQAAVERVASLDLLINNAGIALYDDLSDRSVLEQHLAVNLFGPYQITQAFLPLLTRSRGAIVNNVSLMAFAPVPL